MPDLNHTRNFCIIAHVDHGKTTLSDRILELTRTVEMREMKINCSTPWIWSGSGHHDQEPSRLDGLQAQDGKDHTFINRYTEPVDFSCEVSRSLAACENLIGCRAGHRGTNGCQRAFGLNPWRLFL